MYAALCDTIPISMPTALHSTSKLRRTNLNNIPRHRLALRNYKTHHQMAATGQHQKDITWTIEHLRKSMTHQASQ